MMPLREGRLLPSGRGLAWGWVEKPTGPATEEVLSGLFLTQDAGHTWVDITPLPGFGWTVFDDQFVDETHGFAALNQIAFRGLFARTVDMGASWELREDAVPEMHHAGSSVQLSFADPNHAWLYTFDPVATECAALEATADGGSTWEMLNRCLPDHGRIRFTTSRVGWLGGAPFSRSRADSLHVTADSGKSWEAVRVSLPEGRSADVAFYDLPNFIGAEAVLAVTLVDGPAKAVAFYTSIDEGRSWQLQALHETDEPSPEMVPSLVPRDALVAVAVADAETWWIGSERPSGPHLELTIDAGRSRESRPAPTVERIDWLQSIGDQVLWVGAEEAIFATFNGGQSWAVLEAGRSH